MEAPSSDGEGLGTATDEKVDGVDGEGGSAVLGFLGEEDGEEEENGEEEEEDGDEIAEEDAEARGHGEQEEGDKTRITYLSNQNEPMVGAAGTPGPSLMEKLYGTGQAPAKTYLVPSMFIHRPPTVWFDYFPDFGMSRKQDRGLVFPFRPRRQESRLLFRQDKNINCVSQTLRRAGFARMIKGSSWNVIWTGHLKPKKLAKLQSYQKINHFPGSWFLGRKDNMCRCLCAMSRLHGKDYDICPKTYLLPADWSLFEREFEEAGKHALYIRKPVAKAEGRGIHLVTKLDQVSRTSKHVIQQYIREPLLINNRKIDCRIYVVVTSFDPLRVYCYEDGLVRFASHDYNSLDDRASKRKFAKDRFMHLTNYSINKNSKMFVANGADDSGSKWNLRALWPYLTKKGVNVEPIREQINDIIVKSIIAAEPKIVGKINSHRVPQGCVYELFGYDILLDNQHKPWLIEVNVMCSLSTQGSELDSRVKCCLMADIYHMVGVVPVDRKKFKEKQEGRKAERLLFGNQSGAGVKRRSLRELRETPLHQLPEEDLEVIMESEDEHRRCGSFTRIYPNKNVKYYSQFFSSPRYTNAVLEKWVEHEDWSVLARFMTERAIEERWAAGRRLQAKMTQTHRNRMYGAQDEDRSISSTTSSSHASNSKSSTTTASSSSSRTTTTTAISGILSPSSKSKAGAGSQSRSTWTSSPGLSKVLLKQHVVGASADKDASSESSQPLQRDGSSTPTFTRSSASPTLSSGGGWTSTSPTNRSASPGQGLDPASNSGQDPATTRVFTRRKHDFDREAPTNLSPSSSSNVTSTSSSSITSTSISTITPIAPPDMSSVCAGVCSSSSSSGCPVRSSSISGQRRGSGGGSPLELEELTVSDAPPPTAVRPTAIRTQPRRLNPMQNALGDSGQRPGASGLYSPVSSASRRGRSRGAAAAGAAGTRAEDAKSTNFDRPSRSNHYTSASNAAAREALVNRLTGRV